MSFDGFAEWYNEKHGTNYKPIEPTTYTSAGKKVSDNAIKGVAHSVGGGLVHGTANAGVNLLAAAKTAGRASEQKNLEYARNAVAQGINFNDYTLQMVKKYGEYYNDLMNDEERNLLYGSKTAQDMGIRSLADFDARYGKVSSEIDAIEQERKLKSGKHLQAMQDINDQYRLGKVGETMQEVGSAVGFMTPSIGASLITKNPTIGLGAMATMAGGSGYGQARDAGASYGQALGYGALTGAKEATIERLMGGPMAKIYGKGLDDVLLKTLGKDALKNNTLKGVAANTARGFAGEAVEEGLATAVDPMLQRATYDPDAPNATLKEIGHDALIGGITGGIMGGGINVLDYASNRNKQKPQQQAAKQQNIKPNPPKHEPNEQKTETGVIAPAEKTEPLKPKLASVPQAQPAQQNIEPSHKHTQDVDINTNINTSEHTQKHTQDVDMNMRTLDARMPQVEPSDSISQETKTFVDLALNKINLRKSYEDLPEGKNMFIKGDTVYINKKKMDAYDSFTVKRILAHEVFHSIENTAEGQRIVDLALEFAGENALQNKIAEYRAEGVELDERGARAEIGADFIEKAMTDEATIDRILTENRTLAQRILNYIKDMIEIIKARRTMSKEEAAELKNLQKARRLYENALSKAQKGEYEAGFYGSLFEDSEAVSDNEEIRNSVRSLRHDTSEGKMREDLITKGGMSEAEADAYIKNLNDLADHIESFQSAFLDSFEEYGKEDRATLPYKNNSDPLYKISLDFSTLCKKRIITQATIEALQVDKGRALSAEEQVAIRDYLKELKETNDKIEVACAMCYVEAARLRTPKWINKFIENPTAVVQKYLSTKNPANKQAIKDAGIAKRRELGYADDATLKDIKAKNQEHWKAVKGAQDAVKDNYQATDPEELAVLDFLKNEFDPNMVLTASGMMELKKRQPTVYTAFNAYLAGKAKSKALQTSEPYYYGDSTAVSDELIEQMNAENGLRHNSWSDFEMLHLLDLLVAVTELSVRGAKMQYYSKVPAEFRVLKHTNAMGNISLVPRGATGLDENGNLDFDPIEGVDVDEAKTIRKECSRTAGTVAIGINDKQIAALLDSDYIDYVIPYHTSGLGKMLRKMVGIDGWDNYEPYQNEKQGSKNASEPLKFSDWFHPTQEDIATKSGIKIMREAQAEYLRLCKERGLKPKFSNTKDGTDFTKHENYWKLLIDRKMIDAEGKIIIQEALKPNFDFKYLTDLVTEQSTNSMQDAVDANVEAVREWEEKGGLQTRIKELQKEKKQQKAETKAKQTKDKEYMDAVNRGDMETAQRMVDDAAKRAGYNEEVFHGMRGRYNVYQSGNGQYGAGVYFTYDERTGHGYGDVVDHLYVKIGKIADFDDAYKALGYKDNQSLDEFAQALGFDDFDSMVEDWENDPTNVENNSELVELLMNDGFEGFVDDGNSGFVLWDFDGIEYRIKLADAVTYDDDGKVIPLSERFNPQKEDVRYNTKEYEETGDKKQSVPYKFYENTFQNTPIFDDAAKEAELLYGHERERVSEKETIEEAKRRLEENGWEKEMRSLSRKKDLDGADTDVAMGIMSHMNDFEVGTDEFDRLMRFSEDYAEKTVEAGQFIQALAKYSRTPTGLAQKGARDIQREQKKVMEKEPKKWNKAEKTANEVRNAVKQAQEDSIDEIIDSLARRIIGHTENAFKVVADENAQLQKSIVDELYRLAKESPLPEKPIAEQKKDYVAHLRNILRNREKYEDVWDDAREIVAKKFKDDPEKMQALEEYFDNYTVPIYSKESLNRAIAQEAKDSGIDWNAMLFESRASRKEKVESLKSALIEKMGIEDEQTADIVANDILDSANKVVAKKAQSYLEAVEKRAEDKELKPIKKQLGIKEKVVKMLKNGTYSADEATRLVRAVYDIPTLTSEDMKKVLAYYEKAAEFEEGSYDNRKWNSKAADIIAEKTPKSLADKNKAFRRIMMLLNPVTMNRNTTGNILGNTAEMVKNIPAGMIDIAVSKKTGVRTTSMNPLADAGAYMKGVKKGVTEWKDDIMLGVDTSANAVREEYQGGGKTFKNKGIGKVLNKAETVMSKGLQLGDRPFYEGAYAQRINELKRLGYDVESDSVKEIAQQYALERVYQNDSETAKAITELRRALNKFGGFGDLLLPFVQTPANILDKTIDYSGVGGALRAMLQLGRASKTGEFDQKLFVDRLGRAFTGGGLITIGWAMAASGMLVGDEDENQKVKQAYRLQGVKPYAIHIDGKHYTIEWATPVSSLLLAGAEGYEAGLEEDDLMKVAIVTGQGMINSLLATSVLQSLSQLLTGYQDAASKIMGVFVGGGSQYTSSLLRRMNNVIDPVQRQTYDPNPVKSQLKYMASGVPGLSKTLEPKYDIEGNVTMKSQGRDLKARLVENFVSPGYYTDKYSGKVNDELIRLHEKTGETTQMLHTASKKVDLGESGTYALTAHEYNLMQQTMGKNSTSSIEKLMNSKWYKSHNDGERVDAISKIVTYYDQEYRVSYAKKNGISYTNESYESVKEGLDLVNGDWSNYFAIKEIADVKKKNSHIEDATEKKEANKKAVAKLLSEIDGITNEQRQQIWSKDGYGGYTGKNSDTYEEIARKYGYYKN